MARNVRIIHPRDFVIAKPDGRLDLEETEKLFRELAAVSESLEHFDILIDSREAASILSAADLMHLADRLVKYPKTFAGRTAIVCPPERFDHVSFFALSAEKKHIDVRAFTSFEEAIGWLNEERGPAPE